MSEEEQSASITATVVETDEEAFVPKQAIKIEAILEPLEEPPEPFYPPDYLDFYGTIVPPFIPKYEELPEFEAPPKEIIINIETTGAKPWEARLICIGVMNPNSIAPETLNFIQETEEETLDEFIAWLGTTEYSTLIGYNVAFDYRFLYVLMQKYRKSVPRWKEMELYDLMQQQKQVKHEFVFGFNPTGKLEEWATLLLGTKPYAAQKQVYKWWKEKNVDEIVNFNSDKITKAYYLWVLDKVVSATIPGAEVLSRPGTETVTTPEGTLPGQAAGETENIKVQCPNCMQGQEMPKTAKVINCFVCGTPISNPGL